MLPDDHITICIFYLNEKDVCVRPDPHTELGDEQIASMHESVPAIFEKTGLDSRSPGYGRSEEIRQTCR